MSIDPTAEDYYRNATIEDVNDWQASHQNDKLANLCRYLMGGRPREPTVKDSLTVQTGPAEPVREWRVAGIRGVGRVASETDADSIVSLNPLGWRKQYSIDGGKTWRDAATNTEGSADVLG